MVDYPYSLDLPQVWRTMKKTNEMGTSQVTKQENRSMKNIQNAKKTMGSKVVKTILVHKCNYYFNPP
jgi:hypothetical protein